MQMDEVLLSLKYEGGVNCDKFAKRYKLSHFKYTLCSQDLLRK
jgi:hypothetical protein